MSIHLKIHSFLLVILFCSSNVSFAAYSESCAVAWYSITSGPATGSVNVCTINLNKTTPSITFSGCVIKSSQTFYTFNLYVSYYESSTSTWTNATSQINHKDTIDAVTSAGFVSLNGGTLASVYGNQCPNNCSTLTGQVNYDLKQFDDVSQTPSNGDVCYEDCKQSAEVLWSDCLAGSCVASVKYTQTGQSCGTETSVSDLQTDPPDRCTDQINEKIAQCGGSLKVLSFDFESCTGECTPDACGDQWTKLVDRCGGIMAVSSWNAETCSGSCANDPLPDPQDPATEAVPEEVKKATVTNPDGTSEVTTTTTYNVDNIEYTKTTTTTYDTDGNETGTTTSTSTASSADSSGDDDGEDETFGSIAGPSGFGTAYAPGDYDIPGRFSSFLQNVKSSGLFSFSSSFFNSLPSGGSSELVIDGGQTFGSHTFDFSQSLGGGLAILKSVLLALFGFLSIRAIIMKR